MQHCPACAQSRSTAQQGCRWSRRQQCRQQRRPMMAHPSPTALRHRRNPVRLVLRTWNSMPCSPRSYTLTVSNLGGPSTMRALGYLLSRCYSIYGMQLCIVAHWTLPSSSIDHPHVCREFRWLLETPATLASFDANGFRRLPEHQAHENYLHYRAHKLQPRDAADAGRGRHECCAPEHGPRQARVAQNCHRPHSEAEPRQGVSHLPQS